MLELAPWAYMATPEDDRGLDLVHLRKSFADEHSATFATEAEGELVAVAGIGRGKPPKFAHRATVWGVFAEPAHRGKGLGRAVVAATIELARTWRGVDFVDLGVSENAPEAQGLYESLGFRAWGRQPEAIEHAGRRYDEIFMALRL